MLFGRAGFYVGWCGEEIVIYVYVGVMVLIGLRSRELMKMGGDLG